MYFHGISHNMEQLDNPQRKTIVKHLIMDRFYESSYLFSKKNIEQQNDNGLRIFEEFLNLLFVSRKSGDLECYAKAIEISPKHLNDSVRQASGKSAVKWIEEHQIQQAKVLLGCKDETIKQIGYELGFSSPAVFTRFFKRNTGISPTEYRTKLTNSSNVQPKIRNL